MAVAIQVRRRSPASVLVVEAGDSSQERIGGTVPPDILLPLHRLGLGSRFREAGHLPCPGSMSSWGREKVGHNDFILNPMGPAWHLNRSCFEAMLADEAIQAGATLVKKTRFVGAERTSRGYEVLLRHRSKGEYQTHAEWIIDATGPNARFARWHGAKRRNHDRMMAVARFTSLRSGSFPSQTILEATREGWWYGARLPEDRLVTMFVADYEHGYRLRADGYAVWKEALRSTTLLGPLVDARDLKDEKFLCVPVLSSQLDRVEGERWLAIGDAASCYDPISSQGIYKALIDGVESGTRVAAALSPTSATRHAFRLM